MSATGLDAATKRSASTASKLALTLLAIASMLAASELVLRTVAKPSSHIVFQSLEHHLDRVQLRSFTDVIVNDPELFWRLAPNKSLPAADSHIRGLVSNGAGLREDHEIPLEKPPGEKRILFLGDSCTFGFGVLHADSFVEMAERLLKRGFPSVPVECINAGVPGYSLMQGWRQMSKTGLSYHPDLIVAAFGWNDARTWTHLSDLQHFEARQKTIPPGWLAKSEMCRRLWGVAHRLGTPPGPAQPVPRVSPAEFEDILRRMRELASTHHAEFLPMVWPIRTNFPREGSRPLSDYQEVVYRLGRDDFTFGLRQEPGFIDPIPSITEALRQHPMNELFIDGVHTRPPANALIAEAVVNKIGNWYAPSELP